MQKRKSGGFTLVELVVVIAVLAILAGVGVVAYNGYIEYAHKGVDRQTVGEIMHAIELADYADPTLFGESGGAMIVISTKNTDAAGLDDDNTAALKNALEDALGEGGLASTKLSYDKWSGTANMNVFAGLGNEGSQVDTYIKNLKDSENGVSAAFAEDFEQYWGAFENLVKAINEPGSVEGIEGSNKFFQGVEGNIIKTLVERYKDTENKSKTIETWGQAALDGSELMNADLLLAQNYSFISYLKRQDLSPEARTVVENYLVENPYNLNINLLNVEKWCSGNVKTELEKYATSYNGTQAEADARAYLGLMEAAAQVQSNLKEGYTDADFLAALDPYVPMVSNILTGKTDLTAIKKLAKDTEGSVVIISTTKRNGVLSFSVSPEDANPRTDGTGAGAIEYVTSIKVTDYDNIPQLVLGTSTNNVGTVELPDTGYDISASDSYDKNVISATISQGKITVRAVGAGQTDITLAYEGRPSSSTPPTVKIHVVVN